MNFRIWGRKKTASRAVELKDISTQSWLKRGGIIDGRKFEKILLAGKRIYPDFIESKFENCVFRQLKTKGHFWGASNLWKDCVFEDLILEEVMSPQNRFENCNFKNVTIKKYSPHDTVFINCTFENLTLEAMYTRPNVRNSMIKKRIAELWDFPEIDELDKRYLTLMFRGCRFERPEFTNCLFAHMSFEDSVFTEPSGQGNRIDSIEGDNLDWVNAVQQKEGQSAYIQALRDMIDEKLGPESWSSLRLKALCESNNGKQVESIWLGDFLEGGIPSAEYDVIERITDQLNKRFPPI